MPRIKIVESGWEGFNGSFGTAVFEDGIAEVSLSKPTISAPLFAS